MISTTCKYAIRAVIFVASNAGAGMKFNVKDIAKGVDAPEAFTAKILRTLNKHRILTSLKGPYGGFYIEPFQLEQSVIHVVDAIDGLSIFKECGLGLKLCSEDHPCPIHPQYKAARTALLEAFENTTIAQLAHEVNSGTSFIKNAL